MTDKTAEEAAREFERKWARVLSLVEKEACIKELAALLESHASERERAAIEQQWRPIETAPKDGTPFIAKRFDATSKYARAHECSWNAEKENTYKVFARALGREGTDSVHSSWLNDWPPGYAAPTHWMPPPAPPKDQRQAKEDA